MIINDNSNQKMITKRGGIQCISCINFQRQHLIDVNRTVKLLLQNLYYLHGHYQLETKSDSW